MSGDAPVGSSLPDLWSLGPGEVISVVGAGGKSTLLELLARGFEAEGRRVILTTTTRMWPPPTGPGARPLVTGTELAQVLGLLAEDPGRSPVVGRSVLPDGKLEAIPVDWVPALRDLPWVEAVVVEADGSAGKPLKAPAPWEPVVPSCCTLLVVVAGLDAQGATLDASQVHRPELLSALLGVPVGAALPDEAPFTASLLGYREAVPIHARLLILMNKVDVSPPRPDLLKAVAEAQDVRRVEVWSGTAGAAAPTFDLLRPAQRVLNAVVLAAGRATRMGGAKVLASFGGRTLLERALGTARAVPGVGSVICVVRGEDEELVRGLAVLQDAAGAEVVRLVVNREPERGMASSIALAAGVVGAGDLLLVLADQPFAGSPTVGRLLSALDKNPRAAAVALGVAGEWTPPVILSRTLVPRLLRLQGDRGARSLLERFEDRLVLVPAENDESLDVDTPADMERARKLLS
jgi:probable selenium-dependent hydroxylase accessory protein YqeC